MHTIAEEQLEVIASGGMLNAIYIAAFGVSFGAFLTLACTVYSVTIMDAKKNAIFFALMVMFGFVSLILLIKVSVDLRKTSRKMNEYRKAPAMRRW
ncbi:MAG TPA: hypothetical protein VFW25_10535 [Silvibacterium sp.]|nr:hypothetical protein [Silvibacterium sp.]